MLSARHLGNPHDPCRFVALAAVRCGCQIGAVGLTEQTIAGNRGGDLAEIGGFRKGHDARKGDVHAERKPFFGKPRRTGETVKDATQVPAAALLAQDRQRVVFCLTRVNDDRQIQLARQPHLGSEHRLLNRFRGEVVVVIEADLTERPRARRFGNDGADDRCGFRIHAPRTVQLDVDGRLCRT